MRYIKLLIMALCMLGATSVVLAQSSSIVPQTGGFNVTPMGKIPNIGPCVDQSCQGLSMPQRCALVIPADKQAACCSMPDYTTSDACAKAYGGAEAATPMKQYASPEANEVYRSIRSCKEQKGDQDASSCFGIDRSMNDSLRAKKDSCTVTCSQKREACKDGDICPYTTYDAWHACREVQCEQPFDACYKGCVQINDVIDEVYKASKEAIADGQVVKKPTITVPPPAPTPTPTTAADPKGLASAFSTFDKIASVRIKADSLVSPQDKGLSAKERQDKWLQSGTSTVDFSVTLGERAIASIEMPEGLPLQKLILGVDKPVQGAKTTVEMLNVEKGGHAIEQAAIPPPDPQKYDLSYYLKIGTKVQEEEVEPYALAFMWIGVPDVLLPVHENKLAAIDRVTTMRYVKAKKQWIELEMVPTPQVVRCDFSFCGYVDSPGTSFFAIAIKKPVAANPHTVAPTQQPIGSNPPNAAFWDNTWKKRSAQTKFNGQCITTLAPATAASDLTATEQDGLKAFNAAAGKFKITEITQFDKAGKKFFASRKKITSSGEKSASFYGDATRLYYGNMVKDTWTAFKDSAMSSSVLKSLVKDSLPDKFLKSSFIFVDRSSARTKAVRYNGVYTVAGTQQLLLDLFGASSEPGQDLASATIMVDEKTGQWIDIETRVNVVSGKLIIPLTQRCASYFIVGKQVVNIPKKFKTVTPAVGRKALIKALESVQ